MDRPAVKSLDPNDVERGAPLNPRVVDAEPQKDYKLTLLFTNGEVRVFDVRPYLDKGVFQVLQDLNVFSEVWVEAGSVEWPGGAGLNFDTLYLKSVPVKEATSL